MIRFAHFLGLFLLSIILVTGCQTSKSGFQALVKDVEEYHRDLLFQRYEIAARRIAPTGRAAWLEGMTSQNLRFAEIEIVSSSPCRHSETKEEEGCYIVESHMQWYPGNAPTVYSGRVFSTWEYSKPEKGWIIVEQEQKY